MSRVCGDDGMTRLGKAPKTACNNNLGRSSSAERDDCVTRHARADAKLTVNRPLCMSIVDLNPFNVDRNSTPAVYFSPKTYYVTVADQLR